MPPLDSFSDGSKEKKKKKKEKGQVRKKTGGK